MRPRCRKAEDHRDRKVVAHCKAEGSEGGDAKGDDLGDREKVGFGFRAISVDGFDGGGASVVDIAAGDGKEHRGQEGDDEVEEKVWFGCRFDHVARALNALSWNIILDF
jgi:hypothetical protein